MDTSVYSRLVDEELCTVVPVGSPYIFTCFNVDDGWTDTVYNTKVNLIAINKKACKSI